MGQCCCCGGYKPSEDEDTTLPNTLPNLEEKPAETPYPVMASYDKTFTIYTSTTDPRKILKHQTQILLTVTPRDQSKLFIDQTPIAWKVLDFPPQSDIPHSVTWHADPGFSVSGRFEQNIPVSLGQSGVLTTAAGGAVWDTIQGQRGKVMARNETGIPQTFSLGSVDEEDQFEAFVRFTATPTGGAITVDPAVILQAYAVTGYKPGKPLSQVDSNSFLFKRYDGTPGPKDLTTAQNNSAYLLYSGPSGKVVLE